MFTKAWLSNAFQVTLVAFLTSFLGALAASGANLSLTAVHAATIAGYTAAIAALQALLAAPISPASSSTALLPKAAGQRLVAAARGTGRPEAPLTRTELVEALTEALKAVQAQPQPVPPYTAATDLTAS